LWLAGCLLLSAGLAGSKADASILYTLSSGSNFDGQRFSYRSSTLITGETDVPADQLKSCDGGGLPCLEIYLLPGAVSDTITFVTLDSIIGGINRQYTFAPGTLGQLGDALSVDFGVAPQASLQVVPSAVGSVTYEFASLDGRDRFRLNTSGYAGYGEYSNFTACNAPAAHDCVEVIFEPLNGYDALTFVTFDSFIGNIYQSFFFDLGTFGVAGPHYTSGFVPLGALALLTVRSVADPVPDANAVPEPATWALLITGFAMIGGALRRLQPLSLCLRRLEKTLSVTVRDDTNARCRGGGRARSPAIAQSPNAAPVHWPFSFVFVFRARRQACEARRPSRISV
jgi:hypothetical protein